jgi:AcrR family transcriptional regulator
MRLYEKRGYHRVTVEEICREASVCKKTFYNHFKSRDQIVLEYFLQNDLHFKEVGDRLSQLGTSKERFAAFREALVARVLEQGLFVLKPVYYSQIAPSAHSSRMGRRRRPIHAVLERLVEEGQKRGEIRTDRTSHEIAEAIRFSFRGIMYEWCLQDGKLDLEKATKNMMELLTDAVLKR